MNNDSLLSIPKKSKSSRIWNHNRYVKRNDNQTKTGVVQYKTEFESYRSNTFIMKNKIKKLYDYF